MEQDAAQYIGPIAYRVAQACIPHFYQKLARFDFIQNHILENEWGPRTIDDVGFCRDLFLGYHDASMSLNAHSSRVNLRAKFDFERYVEMEICFPSNTPLTAPKLGALSY